MKLCKHHGYKVITNIKAPRYHDKKALIGVYQISKKHDGYLIKFSDTKKDGSLQYPQPRYGSRSMIIRHKIESNGSIDNYAVPMDKLEVVEIKEHCEHEYI